MIEQAAVIPTIGASPMLHDLLACLHRAGVGTIWLYDNWTAERGQRDQADEDRLWDMRDIWNVQYKRVDQSIYASWNEAMDEAEDRSIPILHVLNDDVTLDPVAIYNVAAALHASTYAIMGYDHRGRPPGGPVTVHGSYRKHGVPGFAFAVKPDYCARVHEGFTWWGGDDDLFNRTESLGEELAVLPGARVEHPQPSLSSHRYPLTEPWHDSDRALMMQLWGEAW